MSYQRAKRYKSYYLLLMNKHNETSRNNRKDTHNGGASRLGRNVRLSVCNVREPLVTRSRSRDRSEAPADLPTHVCMLVRTKWRVR